MDQTGEFAVGNINFFRVVSRHPRARSRPRSESRSSPQPRSEPCTNGASARGRSGRDGHRALRVRCDDLGRQLGARQLCHRRRRPGDAEQRCRLVERERGAPGAGRTYFEARFTPVANKPYRVWMRLRANADSKFNDSIWLQFSGAVDANGAPLWRIGTLSGMLVNLESCANCGVSGWGWQTGAWWVPQDSIVRFPAASRTDAARANSRRRCPNRSDYPEPDDLPRFAAGNANQ